MNEPTEAQVWSALTDLDIMRFVESVCRDDEIVPVDEAHRLAIAIRDHMQERVTELEQANARLVSEAGQWVPVPDGEYEWGEEATYLMVKDEGYRLTLINYAYDGVDAIWMKKGYALCRRTSKGASDA